MVIFAPVIFYPTLTIMLFSNLQILAFCLAYMKM